MKQRIDSDQRKGGVRVLTLRVVQGEETIDEEHIEEAMQEDDNDHNAYNYCKYDKGNGKKSISP